MFFWLVYGFQSTLPIREETNGRLLYHPARRISIHSSHTGRDFAPQGAVPTPCHFNPLFPYGKRRYCRAFWAIAATFQSTLPIREETMAAHRIFRLPEISIHSSHTGRDTSFNGHGGHAMPFQSTLPIREETYFGHGFRGAGIISIHSSHTGRDSKRIQPFCTKSCSICTT